MSLFIKKFNYDFKDMEVFEKLNNSAFPQEERIEIKEMLELIKDKKIEVSAIYDADTFIGFYALVVQKPIAYIFFLAIDSTKRSQGYGTKALALMKEQYSDYQIVLDMESIEETAENIIQRKSRKKFYLRNGYYETGFYMKYNGLTMEILCNNPIFNSNDFKLLLQNLEIRKIPFYLFQAN